MLHKTTLPPLYGCQSPHAMLSWDTFILTEQRCCGKTEQKFSRVIWDKFGEQGMNGKRRRKKLVKDAQSNSLSSSTPNPNTTSCITTTPHWKTQDRWREICFFTWHNYLFVLSENPFWVDARPHLCSHETPSETLQEPPAQEGRGPLGVGPEVAVRMTGAYRTSEEGHFTGACSDRTRVSNWMRVDVRRKFFIINVVRYWYRLPREAANASPPEMLKVRLDGVLDGVPGQPDMVSGNPDHGRG